jgi:ZIP family zinc transporter
VCCISEPLAAVIGLLILGDNISNFVFGAMFGVVAGMMVTISVRELLPTAHKYDPTDTVATYAFISGMGVMALSIVLFLI